MKESGYLKLDSVSIENYRSLASFNAKLDPRLTVFVGINGAGKTTILDAIGFIHSFLAARMGHVSPYQLPWDDMRKGEDQATFKFAYSDYFDDITRAGQTLEANFSIKGDKVMDDDLGVKVINFLKGMDREEYPHNLPVLVQYGARRISGGKEGRQNVNKPLQAAFGNAFGEALDFKNASSWFIEKSIEEALARQNGLDSVQPELDAARKAIALALGDYCEPTVLSPEKGIVIAPKNDPKNFLTVQQLSDGYRAMLALVLDLARRMAIANQYMHWRLLDEILKSPAIVLIDEIELHLHPSWQQRVLPDLMRVFPNAQFIVTTHSPQVLSAIGKRHIRIIEDGDAYEIDEETEGAEASRILSDIFDTPQRPAQNRITTKIEKYARLVDSENWESDETRQLGKELNDHFNGRDPGLSQLERRVNIRKWEKDEGI